MSELFRPAIAEIVPYEPGKPVEEVQRELGLERVVKLASNEGPFPPFPAALAAMDRAARELNRYPDGGAWELRSALAAHHGVRFEEIVVGSGADGVIDLLSQATLDEGDEIVCGWPSFPSYALAAAKLGANVEARPVAESHVRPRRTARGDRAAHEARLRLPSEQPDGHGQPARPAARVLRPRAGTRADGARPGVLRIHRRPRVRRRDRGVFKRGHRVVVLRTFSKIYGLAGVRVGYGVAPADVVVATSKVRRAFDVTAPAQAAAVASIGQSDELARRRAANAAGRAQLEQSLRAHGLEPAGPALGNFLFVEVGDGRALFRATAAQGVIVRPLAGFGAPEAIRVSVGTEDENAFFAAALGHVLSGVSS